MQCIALTQQYCGTLAADCGGMTVAVGCGVIQRPCDRAAVSVFKIVTAGQDETDADVNRASSGAIEIRDRWLKVLAQECLRDDDVSRLASSSCNGCSSNLPFCFVMGFGPEK